MKNILFIGPYRQADGWGDASRSYIKAIASTNNNLTIHPNYFTNNITDIPQEVSQYEQKFFDNYDIVIQKALPGCFFYNGSYKKNIAITELETSDWSRSSCIRNLNEMDEVWVPSEFERQTLLKGGVYKPVKAISQPLDIDFIKKNSANKLPLPKSISNTFKFYFIGEYIERKNINDLILAFNLAFDYDEPISLIIKTNSQGSNNPNQLRQKIEQDIIEIKKKMGTGNKFKKEIIITERLTNEQMIGLHNACDCFVNAAYGEAFCRPAAEALVLGKTPIVNKNTGMKDFINNDNGFLVNSYKTPVLLENRPLSADFDFYNSYQYWYKIDIYDLIDKLKNVYSLYQKNKTQIADKAEIGKSNMDSFSYSTIGSKLCI
jgi:glycosyltransferase involved in cell wall biosynthesis